MKVQQQAGTGQQIATIVKTPGGAQSGQQSGTLTFPLQLSQVKTVNKVGGAVGKQQTTTQVQQLSAIQQQLLLQRQKQQQQQQLQQAPTTASKMAQMGQVR